jgi:hypothetical protein
MDSANSSPVALWNQAFERVRQTVQSPMVWLAMQSATPITIDGNFFVVGLSHDKQYLATNLQTFETVSAIEEALKDTSGHILALRLIEGVTEADYETVRWKQVTAQSGGGGHGDAGHAPGAAPGLTPEAPREVSPNWQALNEYLSPMYKAFPYIRYPHGQAQFILDAVKHISDTMDVMMPGPGEPPSDVEERNLSKVLERLSSTVNLDAIFLAMELFRYRRSRGK